jgi:hypothetical protein
MRHGHPRGSITIRFNSGQYQTLKTDSAKVEDGVLILFVYTNDRSKLQPTHIFPIETVGGGPAEVRDRRFRRSHVSIHGIDLCGVDKGLAIGPQWIKMTKRIWLEIIVGCCCCLWSRG